MDHLAINLLPTAYTVPHSEVKQSLSHRYSLPWGEKHMLEAKSMLSVSIGPYQVKIQKTTMYCIIRVTSIDAWCHGCHGNRPCGTTRPNG